MMIYYTYYLEFKSNGTYAYSVLNSTCGIMNGTWKVSDDTLTMVESSHKCNNYKETTSVGTYSVQNEGAKLYLNDLHIYTGTWTRYY